MNGFEATKAIRHHENIMKTRPVPIIALSGYAQDREKQEAATVGMNDYLSKPVRSRDLFNKLSEHLARSEETQTAVDQE